MTSKKKRPRIITVLHKTVFYTRAGDEYSAKNPVLTLTKEQIDENRKRSEKRNSKNKGRSSS